MKQSVIIDVGNTLVKIGIYNEDELACKFSFKTLDKSEDELSFVISDLCKSHSIDLNLENNVIISSVVPSLNVSLKNAVKKVFKPLTLVFIPGKVKTGLAMKVDNPGEVGSDLIADMVGAKEKYSLPIIVIDAGTVTKILLLDKDGFFSSASFMPGLIMSAKSLASEAEQLPNISLETPSKIVARNTMDCMNVGLLYGHAEAIKGLVERLEEELGYKCHHILTGGNAHYIKDLIRDDELICDNDLALIGLKSILKKNL